MTARSNSGDVMMGGVFKACLLDSYTFFHLGQRSGCDGMFPETPDTEDVHDWCTKGVMLPSDHFDSQKMRQTMPGQEA